MARHRFTAEECQRGAATRTTLPDWPAHQARNFAITAARYGEDFARRLAAAKRQSRPTAGEAWVRATLIAWGFVEGPEADFQREVQIWLERGHEVYLDFVVATAAGQRLVIEVDGRQHDPVADAARDARLLALGYPTLRLPTDRIRRQPEAARRQLLAALRPAPDDTGELAQVAA